MRIFKTTSILVLLLPLALAGCRGAGSRASEASAATRPVRFEDVTQAAGIRFKHTTGGSGRLYLPEGLGSGCAFLDYNNDGLLDLYLVNAAPLPGFKGGVPAAPGAGLRMHSAAARKEPFYPALYRNRGDGKFEDVTRAAGLATERYGIGVTAGDYDNDGWVDLYLTALGPNALYHNNGDGTFTDVTRKAGVADDAFSSSCAWVDIDRDGLLDLFVCNYALWTPAINQICPDTFGRRHPCPPGHYRGVSSRLFRNRGNGTFTDITRSAGVFSSAGKALGILVWDFNDDGWPDLMVANDLEPNLLYRNNRNGTFTEMGVEAGVAYSAGGKARAGMGIDSADIDQRGRESVLIGNGASEMLALFREDPDTAAPSDPTGGAHFVDAAWRTGLAGPSLRYLTFGVLFADYDLDGRKDILTANGHIDPYVAVHGGDTTFPEPLRLFHNEPAPGGGARFTEVSATAGEALRKPRVHRGLAMGDYDGDGDPDFLVSVADGPPVLLRNDALRASVLIPHPSSFIPDNAGRHWLILKPIGMQSNRNGIGTRFVVHAGGVRQIGWVRSGSSYASQSDLRAYFGLGAATRVDSLEIRWPNGSQQVLTNLPVNRSLVIKEGQGLIERPEGRKHP